MNLLITGGAGFIGSNFVQYWQRFHPKDRITIIDSNTYAANWKNLEGTYGAYYEIDINNQELVLALIHKNEIDTIVHFAAETHVDRSIANPKPFVEANVNGTLALLECIDPKLNIRFHHVSTDEVYGSILFGSAKEGAPYAPNNPYSATKAASDHLVRSFVKTYGLNATISHCTNNYGPNQYPEKLIPKVIHHAIVGQTIPIYGTGHQRRDWIYVWDHCRAIDLILKKGKAGQVYNISANMEHENQFVIRQICKILNHYGPSSHPDYSKLIMRGCARDGDDYRYALDSSKLRKMGWKPQVTFEHGLKLTVLWYLECLMFDKMLKKLLMV